MMCSKSLRYTVIEETKNVIPRTSKNSMAKISGKKSKATKFMLIPENKS